MTDRANGPDRRIDIGAIKRAEKPHRPARERWLRRVRAHHTEAVPRVDQPRPFDDDGAMRKTATKFEQRGVAGLGGGVSCGETGQRGLRL